MSDKNVPPPIDYDNADIKVIPGFEAIRRHPDIWVGDTGSFGLHFLARDLLDVVYRYAERGMCGKASLQLGEDGALRLFDSGPAVPPAKLFKISHAVGKDYERSIAVTLAFALSSRFQVDMWSGGQQWRAQGARGILSGEFSEVKPAEPIPMDAAQGVRVDFLPDPDIFEQHVFEAERLLQLCREFAFHSPGLRIHFTAPQGVDSVVHYPGGLAQRVEELTRDLPRLHPHPLAFEVHWNDVHVRCALQWCESGGGIESFGNTWHTALHSGHVEGVIRAIRAALATLADGKTSDSSKNLLMRGLVAIITAEGRLEFRSGGPPMVLVMKGLDIAVEERLCPLLVDALRDHPLLPRLVALARARE